MKVGNEEEKVLEVLVILPYPLLAEVLCLVTELEEVCEI